MSEAVAQKPTNEIDVLRKQIRAIAPELSRALPSHIKPEKFERVVMTVVQMTPDLLLADRRSLLASSMKCAADGLVPDGRESAFVIFNTKQRDPKSNKDVWIKKVQYMPMFAGIQKRARNTGEISSLQAHVIYSEDKFIWRQGLDEHLEHEPKFPGDRGKPIGAYAIVKFKDGSEPQFEVMDVAEIEKVRKVSKAADSGPWVLWWGEMARKTVFKRLSKWLPASADAVALASRADEDALQTVEDDQRTAIEGAVSATPSVHALVGPQTRLQVLEMMAQPTQGAEVIDASCDAETDTIMRGAGAGMTDAG